MMASACLQPDGLVLPELPLQASNPGPGPDSSHPSHTCEDRCCVLPRVLMETEGTALGAETLE